MGDLGRDVVEAVDTVDGPGAGLVPPIRPVWNVLTVAWKAAAATVKEQGARQSWRARTFEERKATFEEVERLEEEARAWRDTLGGMLACLVLWPFFVLLWLIMLPLALPSCVPSPARVVLAIAFYGLMVWLFPMWLFPTLAAQMDGWWRWAVIVFAFGPFIGALLNAVIAWLVAVRRRT